MKKLLTILFLIAAIGVSGQEKISKNDLDSREVLLIETSILEVLPIKWREYEAECLKDTIRAERFNKRKLRKSKGLFSKWQFEFRYRYTNPISDWGFIIQTESYLNKDGYKYQYQESEKWHIFIKQPTFLRFIEWLESFSYNENK